MRMGFDEGAACFNNLRGDFSLVTPFIADFKSDLTMSYNFV